VPQLPAHCLVRGQKSSTPIVGSYRRAILTAQAPISFFEKPQARATAHFCGGWWTRIAAVLLTLVLTLLVVGGALAQSQADAPHATNLYPGRYVAVCKPAPIIGCLCSSDPQGEMSVFPELIGAADHRSKDVRDAEYLQMLTWLRRTCTSVTRPTNIE
jgi:hypothetical protein